jgi:hypothetical protein
MVSETPFFVKSIAGSMMINAFEAQLHKHNIRPIFKNMVLRRELEDGKNVVDAFYGFEKRGRIDVEFILYTMQEILERCEPNNKKRKRELEGSQPMKASRFAEPDVAPML